ncbi:MAG: BREX-1 system adenine-specific DNA-methyltransferase PglX [Chloroflexota bacterium]|nr:BREX-1 system adenine-specific DNA-methyltransferase PglX [Chloroflexota bacterium]
MSFDRATRTLFARKIGGIRDRLKADVIDQLRRLGFQEDGTTLELDRIAGLSDGERAAGEELRALLEHFVAVERGEARTRRRAAFDRLAREIGFTTLNRLVAIRAAEERGLVVQAVRQGFGSAGFQVYERVANGALGGRQETYRAFLECLYDEIGLDLPLLFDRTDPQSSIFPSERCLEDVFALLNASEIDHLWREDEAIGWVYQYYNDPDERRQMRESQAPRSSRELAVRNQFFTPRYVVEFLTDNTLGRTWYEMRRGETRLVEGSRYLVRRKHPIWLEPGEAAPEPWPAGGGYGWPRGFDFELESRMWTRPNPELTDFQALWSYALTAGYPALLDRFGDLEGIGAFANAKENDYRRSGKWEGSFEDLRACLFFAQRRNRQAEQWGHQPGDDEVAALLALNRAIDERWDLEVEAILHRPTKDPRELRILDPACGSGHFLLYAFDLLLTIYDEAYDDPELAPALRRDYPNRAAYERQVPALVIHHNLHGIDIDPRACQIAALALWLRAQRRWQELVLRPTERPAIRKSQIVCAEPMPGEREFLDEYLQTVDVRLRSLVQTVWEKMQLAGEAGSLLKIEEEIREALGAARVEAMVDGPPVQFTLYERDRKPKQQVLTMATRDEIAFWDQAEAKLLDALRTYATRATPSHATQRRLFAEDAAEGFAFVDVARTIFDVVLMNPPFGDATEAARTYVAGAYPRTKHDLYAAFVERALSMVRRGGHAGAITSRMGFFTKSFQRWRKEILFGDARLGAVADLGPGVLDAATVETAAYTLERVA